MKTFVAGAFFALAFAQSAISAAQEGPNFCSPAQALNNPGDIIHGNWCVGNFGRHDVAVQMFSSGGEGFSWSGWDNHCNNWTVTAATFNESFWWNWVGDPSAWQGSCTITGVVTGAPSVDPVKKQRKQNLVAILRNSQNFFEGFSIGPCVSGMNKVCAAGLIATLFARLTADLLEKTDPWDPDFQSPYDSPWPDAGSLGFNYSGDVYLDNLIGDTQGIVQASDNIYVDTNRVSSCNMAGVDCAGWQTDRANYARWVLAWYLNDASSNLWTIAWVGENQQGMDLSAVDQLRQTAQALGDNADAVEP